MYIVVPFKKTSADEEKKPECLREGDGAGAASVCLISWRRQCKESKESVESGKHQQRCRDNRRKKSLLSRGRTKRGAANPPFVKKTSGRREEEVASQAVRQLCQLFKEIPGRACRLSDVI